MPAPSNCLNCGAALADRYCGACGQDRTLAVRPLREMLAEWGDAVLGWDTRSGRTLRALLLEPGRLTVEFCAGRRAAWLHPLRVYLVTSVVAFGVFRLTTDAVISRYPPAPGTSYSFMGALLVEVSAVMILLLPVFAGAYALAFHRRDRHYAVHLTFVLHGASFSLLAQAAASLVQYPLALAGAPLAAISVPRLGAHALMFWAGFVAARRVYGETALSTLLRIVVASALFLPVLFGALWLIRRAAA